MRLFAREADIKFSDIHSDSEVATLGYLPGVSS